MLLDGDGIASACVARLLADAGVPYTRAIQPRPRLPAILLGEQTQYLLRELFASSELLSEDLFSGFTRITRRIVLWGDADKPVDLPHHGIVAPVADLLERLWHRIPSQLPRQPHPQTLHLQSSRASVAAEPERNFGSRTGRIAQIKLHENTSQNACWVESVSSGWLFLLCLGNGMASLIAVGDTIMSLLARSRLVAPPIDRVLNETSSLPVYPRLLQNLAGPGWIACGSAAMSFDPLCGEGAGHAVREGFLAAALLRSALAGTNPEALAEHYTTRLKQGLLRHLQTCLPFYATGGASGFWVDETASLRDGIATLQSELSHLTPPRFKLVDRDLIAM